MPGVTAVAVAWIGDEYAGAALGPAVGSYVAASVLGGLTGRVGSGLDRGAHSSWRGPFLFFGSVTLLGAVGDGARPPRVAPERRASGAAARSARWRATFGTAAIGAGS